MIKYYKVFEYSVVVLDLYVASLIIRTLIRLNCVFDAVYVFYNKLKIPLISSNKKLGYFPTQNFIQY